MFISCLFASKCYLTTYFQIGILIDNVIYRVGVLGYLMLDNIVERLQLMSGENY